MSALPAALGLVTAGHQANIDETALWQAQNMTADLDGILGLRPGLRPYGQTLKRPDSGVPDPVTHLYPNAVGFSPFLSDTSGYLVTDASSGEITTTVGKGVLQTNAGSATGATYAMGYTVSAYSAKATWSIRFLVRGVGLPAYDGTSSPSGLRFKVQGTAASCREFAVCSGGLYWRRNDTGLYTLVAGSEFVGMGGWNTLEVRNDGTNIRVYLKEVLIDTLTTASLLPVSTLSVTAFEFVWETDPSDSFTTYLSTPMYCDAADYPFLSDPVVALGEFQFDTRSGTKKRCVLAACGNYIYHDLDLLEVWRPLHPKQHAFVNMATYQQNAVWVDYNGGGTSAMWLWDGRADAPTHLSDAPPAEAVIEHQLRLWAIGDHANPHRAYYSAGRQPNVWWTPGSSVEDNFDVALDAGFIPVPSTKRSDRLTAMFGDYYGAMILWTRKSVWSTEGFGPFSYATKNINQTVGCENQNCVTMVGNDLWFGSRSGIRSLAATQQSGNLTVQQPMLVLHQMWANLGRSELLVNTGALARSFLDYNPNQGLVHIALPMFGDSTASSTFVYNVNNQQSYGPWLIDARSMLNVEIGTPLREMMMYGDSNGRVAYIAPMYGVDFLDTTIPGIVESAILTGRSLDPRLVGYMKTWGKLKLYVLVQGDWDLNVSWISYSNQPPSATASTTVNQNVLLKAYVVDKDFRVDEDPDGLLMSGEEISVIDVPLDARGYGLSWKMNIDNNVVLLGWEVEFMADGYEQE